jgi:hypothetical protein
MAVYAVLKLQYLRRICPINLLLLCFKLIRIQFRVRI